jgi:hypothetical protein
LGYIYGKHTFLAGVLLILGIISTYSGGQALLQSDEEFIRSPKKGARQNAKFDKISEQEAMRKYVDYKRENPGFWRGMAVIPLVVGVLMLFGFVITLFL